MPATPAEIAKAMATSTTDATMVLDHRFQAPEPELIESLIDGPADAWHGGLDLGHGQYPRALDHIQPHYMFANPPEGNLEVTSPHVSLRALLVRRTVVDQLGGPDPTMETLNGAGAELGIRWLLAGAIPRHVPGLIPAGTENEPAPSETDEFRMLTRHYGKKWALWALGRAVTQGEVKPRAAIDLAGVIRQTNHVPTTHYVSPTKPIGDTDRTVSVILPTIDRYSYLLPLLEQLAGQTKPPHQVLIVDQTPKAKRRDDLARVTPGLPVEYFTLDQAGQSTARNVALNHATGEFVLFIDDDDEIQPDLIEHHLKRLIPGIDAICGGVDDATAGPPPEGFRHRRASNVFPTNNTLLRRDALSRSGLFDPVFDHGPRADHDLGTRLYRSGAFLVYDPSVMIFHHHAPMGGLRTHGARKITRASSRKSLTQRNFPATTELYLGLRYFTAHQRKEAAAIRVLSTLSCDGPLYRRLARAGIQL
ncbi:MAG: glycosyltransferase family 2 protein, partial [Acidimicrobiales bacterium]|nr:glycosyltransferase family 2 protein [Acidimicrobiales bacterium]